MLYLPEQVAIINSEGDIKVKAGAGTGKTTTLVGYAKNNSKKKLMYVAFNKAIQEEASSRFPSNTVCKTVHSIAYGQVGKFYQAAGKLNNGNLRASDVSKALKIAPSVAKSGIDTINEFLYSSDMSIDLAHALRAGVKNSMQTMAVDCARELWKRMTDIHDKSVMLIHDGYLKLFHVEGNSIRGYDTILMDEAQDANPVTTAIVNASNAENKVYVGDRNQSIYAFRGAMNAMDSLNAKEFPLRTSFRFGPELANVANTILEHSIGDDMRIVGAGSKTMVHHNFTGVEGQVAHIARTNGFLIGRAIDLIDNGQTFHVVGGVDSLKINMLNDVYKLFMGQKDSFVRGFVGQFDSYEEFLYHAGESDDPEMKWLSKTVEKYKKRIPFVVNSIRNTQVADMSKAENILVTGHKAKGLEFDTVRICDDFPTLSEFDSEEGLDEQECNLIYVAVTRAKKNIILNEDLARFMNNPVVNPAVANREGQTKHKRERIA